MFVLEGDRIAITGVLVGGVRANVYGDSEGAQSPWGDCGASMPSVDSGGLEPATAAFRGRVVTSETTNPHSA